MTLWGETTEILYSQKVGGIALEGINNKALKDVYNTINEISNEYSNLCPVLVANNSPQEIPGVYNELAKEYSEEVKFIRDFDTKFKKIATEKRDRYLSQLLSDLVVHQVTEYYRKMLSGFN